jgi:hypothetical protein
MDDDVKQLALKGQMLRAVQLYRERTGADFKEALAAVNAHLPPTHRVRTGRTATIVAAALAIVVGAVAVLGILYVALAGLERASALFTRYVVSPNLAVILQPEVLTVLGVVVCVVGIRFAGRFRRPSRFRGGIIAVALALVTFWPLQYLAAGVDLPYREYSVFLHGLAFFLSLCLLSGGLEAIRRANNTPEADSWEFLDS